jgi:hypothetical protein
MEQPEGLTPEDEETEDDVGYIAIKKCGQFFSVMRAQTHAHTKSCPVILRTGFLFMIQ